MAINLTLMDEKATQHLAQKIALLAKVGDIITLQGTLGMGKTTFARAFIRALSMDPMCEVPSPTFTLLQAYEDLPLSVWHFDLYRLESPEEFEELGIEEALSSGVSLIEWPQRLGAIRFSNTLNIHFSPGVNDGARDVVLEAGQGSWGERLKGLKI